MTPPVGEPTRATGVEFILPRAKYGFCSGPRLGTATGHRMLERQGRGSKSAGVDLEQASPRVLEKGGKSYRIGFPPVTAIVAPDT